MRVIVDAESAGRPGVGPQILLRSQNNSSCSCYVVVQVHASFPAPPVLLVFGKAWSGQFMHFHWGRSKV